MTKDIQYNDKSDKVHSSFWANGFSVSKVVKPFSFIQRLRVRALLLARRLKIAQRYEFILTILAIMSVAASYIAITRDETPFDMTGGSTATILFIINLVLLLLVGVSVGRRFVRIWSSRKASSAAARLHVRITGVFMAIAIIPPIVMAIFSTIFLEYGLQTWFGERVRSTVDNSLKVAQSYIAENRRIIENDAAYLTRYFSSIATLSKSDLRLAAQEAIFQRSLNELLLIELLDGEEEPLVIVRASQGLTLRGGTTALPPHVVLRVQETGSYLATNSGDDTFISLKRLSGFIHPTYLYIARDLNPLILEHYEKTLDAVETFNQLENQQSDFQRQFNILYLFLAVLILLAAIWMGMWFSSRLVDPLTALVQAAQRFGMGDLKSRVAFTPSSDEIGHLSRSFNRMADQLEVSQAKLVRANQKLDERRRFVEEVLENVSAGVIGLDGRGIIFLPNRSAKALLNLTSAQMLAKPLIDLVPEFSDLFHNARSNEKGIAERQIDVRVKGERRVLLVRIARDLANSEKNHVSMDKSLPAATADQKLTLLDKSIPDLAPDLASNTGQDPVSDSNPDGFVVTFDDVTDQLSDQRTAAWADVARRIAHEIKNPLTPIQLSAERLWRRYGSKISEDDVIFEQCTSTIIRQVGDLRRMVDEFSSFARMPAPLFKEIDIIDVVRQAIFLQEVSYPEIEFQVITPEKSVDLLCDGRLIGQAITNIVKNAAESVTEKQIRNKNDNKDIKKTFGLVRLEIIIKSDNVSIKLEDNGLGLPDEENDRLMDPYVTTRKDGTGLGLAIVKRIIEEHGGRVRLSSREEGGARVIVSLNRSAMARKAAEQDAHLTRAAE